MEESGTSRSEAFLFEINLAHAGGGYSPAQVPTISSVEPDQIGAGGGEKVRIVGSSFHVLVKSSTIHVQFGPGDTAVARIISGTELECISPPIVRKNFELRHGRGFHVSLRITNLVDIWSNAIPIFVETPPVALLVSPVLGPAHGGTAVAVLGRHFSPRASLECIFGGEAAHLARVAVPASWRSPNRLECLSPPWPLHDGDEDTGVLLSVVHSGSPRRTSTFWFRYTSSSVGETIAQLPCSRSNHHGTEPGCAGQRAVLSATGATTSSCGVIRSGSRSGSSPEAKAEMGFDNLGDCDSSVHFELASDLTTALDAAFGTCCTCQSVSVALPLAAGRRERLGRRNENSSYCRPSPWVAVGDSYSFNGACWPSFLECLYKMISERLSLMPVTVSGDEVDPSRVDLFMYVGAPKGTLDRVCPYSEGQAEFDDSVGAITETGPVNMTVGSMTAMGSVRCSSEYLVRYAVDLLEWHNTKSQCKGLRVLRTSFKRSSDFPRVRTSAYTSTLRVACRLRIGGSSSGTGESHSAASRCCTCILPCRNAVETLEDSSSDPATTRLPFKCDDFRNTSRYPGDGSAFKLAREPSISSVDPSSGPCSGGTTVVLTGERFAKSHELRCGFGTSVVPAQWVSNRRIQCVSPPQMMASTVFVEVSTNGRDFTSSRREFSFIETRVHEISPAVGSIEGGTVVSIVGEGFRYSANLSAHFGMAKVPVTFVNSTSLTGVAPPMAVPGTVNVSVSLDGIGLQDSWKSSFEFVQAFSISFLEPSWGFIGTGNLVVLHGEGFFSTAELACSFGEYGHVVPAEFMSKRKVSCAVPPVLGRGSYVIKLTLDGRQFVSSPQSFTNLERPELLSLSPSDGPHYGGTTVQIKGVNFNRKSRLGCLFGSDIVEGRWDSSTTMWCTTPVGTPGSRVKVSLTLDHRTYSSTSLSFHFLDSVRSRCSESSGSESEDILGIPQDEADLINVSDGMNEGRGALHHLPGLFQRRAMTHIPAGGPLRSSLTSSELNEEGRAWSTHVSYDGDIVLTDTLTKSGNTRITTKHGCYQGGENVVVTDTIFFSPSDLECAFPESPVVGRLLSPSTVACVSCAGAIGAVTPVRVIMEGVSSQWPPAVCHSDRKCSLGSFLNSRELRAMPSPSVHGAVHLPFDTRGELFANITMSSFTDQRSVTPTLGDDSIGGADLTERSLQLALYAGGDAAPHHLDQTWKVATSQTDVPDTNLSVQRPVPTILSATPDSGSVEGGTVVLLEGASLVDSDELECHFGNAQVSGIWVSSTIIQCVAPARPEQGTVHLVVSSRPGQLLFGGVDFRYYVRPLVQGVSPPHGPVRGGAEVSIHGTGFWFAGDLLVRFGSTDVPATFISSSELRCVVPASSPGASSVAVSLNGVDFDGNADFFYDHDTPSIFASSRPWDRQQEDGTGVFVHDTGCGSRWTAPRPFDGGLTKAPCRLGSYLSFDGPQSPVSVVPTIVAVSGDMTYSSPIQDAFDWRESYVVSAQPDYGPVRGGTPVYVNGFNILDAPGLRCLFGRQPVFARWLSSAQVICTAPRVNYAQDVSLSLEMDGGGRVLGETRFSYYSEPIFSSLIPASGSSNGGAMVELRGHNFRLIEDFGIAFGPITVQATLSNSSVLRCITPASPSRTVEVAPSILGRTFDPWSGVNYTFRPKLPAASREQPADPGGTETCATQPRFPETRTFGFDELEWDALPVAVSGSVEEWRRAKAATGDEALPLNVTMNDFEDARNYCCLHRHTECFTISVTPVCSTQLGAEMFNQTAYSEYPRSLCCRSSPYREIPAQWLPSHQANCASIRDAAGLQRSAQFVVSFSGCEKRPHTEFHPGELGKMVKLQLKKGYMASKIKSVMGDPEFLLDGGSSAKIVEEDVLITVVSAGDVPFVTPPGISGATDETLQGEDGHITRTASFEVQRKREAAPGADWYTFTDAITFTRPGALANGESSAGGEGKHMGASSTLASLQYDPIGDIRSRQGLKEMPHTTESDICFPGNIRGYLEDGEIYMVVLGPRRNDRQCPRIGLPDGVTCQCAFVSEAINQFGDSTLDPTLWLSKQEMKLDFPSRRSEEQRHSNTTIANVWPGIITEEEGFRCVVPVMTTSLLNIQPRSVEVGQCQPHVKGGASVCPGGTRRASSLYPSDDKLLDPMHPWSEWVPYSRPAFPEALEIAPFPQEKMRGLSESYTVLDPRAEEDAPCIFNGGAVHPPRFSRQSRGQIAVDSSAPGATKFDDVVDEDMMQRQYFGPPTVLFFFPLEVRAGTDAPITVEMMGSNFRGGGSLSCRIGSHLRVAKWISESSIRCPLDGINPGIHELAASNDMIEFVAAPSRILILEEESASGETQQVDPKVDVQDTRTATKTGADAMHAHIVEATDSRVMGHLCILVEACEGGTGDTEPLSFNGTHPRNRVYLPPVCIPGWTEHEHGSGGPSMGGESVLVADSTGDCNENRSTALGEEEMPDFAIADGTPGCTIESMHASGMGEVHCGSDFSVPLLGGCLPVIKAYSMLPLELSGYGASLVEKSGRSLRGGSDRLGARRYVRRDLDQFGTVTLSGSSAQGMQFYSPTPHGQVLPSFNDTYGNSGRDSKIFSVSPSAGPMDGGTVVSVISSRATLVDVLWCMFGDSAVSPSEISPSKVRCATPSATTPGRVPIRLVSILGGYTVGDFDYMDYVELRSVRPSVVDVQNGAVLTVSFHGYLDEIVIVENLSCSIGGMRTPARVRDNVSEVECAAPPRNRGFASVTITNSQRLLSRGDVELLYSPRPVVSRIVPNLGSLGESAVIDVHGHNFVNSIDLSCSLGDSKGVEIKWLSTTRVRCTVQVPDTGFTHMSVSNDGVNWGRGSNGSLFHAIETDTALLVSRVERKNGCGVISVSDRKGCRSRDTLDVPSTHRIFDSSDGVTPRRMSPEDTSDHVDVKTSLLGGITGRLNSLREADCRIEVEPTLRIPRVADEPGFRGASMDHRRINVTRVGHPTFGCQGGWDIADSGKMSSGRSTIASLAQARTQTLVVLPPAVDRGFDVEEVGRNFSFIPEGNTLPVVHTIRPSIGPESGGTEILVEGGIFSNMKTLACVVCSSHAVDCVVIAAHWLSPRRLSCVTPEHPPGLVTVAVANNGSREVRGGAAFLFLPQPHVVDISPTRGGLEGGTNVVVRAINMPFTGSITCRFGETLATATFSSSGITCRAPSAAEAKKVFLEISANGVDFTADERVYSFLEFSFHDDLVAQSSGGTEGRESCVTGDLGDSIGWHDALGEMRNGAAGGRSCSPHDGGLISVGGTFSSTERLHSPLPCRDPTGPGRIPMQTGVGSPLPRLCTTPYVEAMLTMPSPESKFPNPCMCGDTSRVFSRLGLVTSGLTGVHESSSWQLRGVNAPLSQCASDLSGHGDFRSSSLEDILGPVALRRTSRGSATEEGVQATWCLYEGDSAWLPPARHAGDFGLSPITAERRANEKLVQLSTYSGLVNDGLVGYESKEQSHAARIPKAIATASTEALARMLQCHSGGVVGWMKPSGSPADKEAHSSTRRSDPLQKIRLLNVTPLWGYDTGGTVLRLAAIGKPVSSVLKCGFFDDRGVLLAVGSAKWTPDIVWCSSPTLPPGRLHLEVSLDGVKYTKGSGVVFTVRPRPLVSSVCLTKWASEGVTGVTIVGMTFELEDTISCQFDGFTVPATVVDSKHVLCRAPSMAYRLDDILPENLALIVNGKTLKTFSGQEISSAIVECVLTPSSLGTETQTKCNSLCTSENRSRAVSDQESRSSDASRPNKTVVQGKKLGPLVLGGDNPAMITDPAGLCPFSGPCRNTSVSVDVRPKLSPALGRTTYRRAIGMVPEASRESGHRPDGIGGKEIYARGSSGFTDSLFKGEERATKTMQASPGRLSALHSQVRMEVPICPDNGPRVGGTPVLVRGVYRESKGIVKCYFGERRTQGFVLNYTHALCFAPPSAGEVVVDLLASFREYNVSSGGALYHYWDAPSISNLAPEIVHSGLGYANVTVHGYGFRNSSSLACALEDGSMIPATYISSNATVCRMPRSGSGSVRLRVTNNGIDLSPNGRRIMFIPQPIITSVHCHPMSSSGLVRIVVGGLNTLHIPGMACILGSKPILASWESGEGLRCEIPSALIPGPLALGVDFGVAVPDAHVAPLEDEHSSSRVEVLSADPSHVDSSGGTEITLRVVNLQRSDGIICRFGSVGNVIGRIVDNYTVQCTAPAGPTGPAPIQVGTMVHGFSRRSVAFSYMTRPRIDSIHPSFGNVAGGTRVKLQGSGFVDDPAMEYLFGDSPARTIIFESQEAVLVDAPPSTSPTVIPVTVGFNGVQSPAVNFRYVPHAILFDVSPKEVVLNETDIVTITGANFLGGSRMTCLFNNSIASEARYLSPNLIECSVPWNIPVGINPMSVGVVTHGQELSTLEKAIFARLPHTVHGIRPSSLAGSTQTELLLKPDTQPPDFEGDQELGLCVLDKIPAHGTMPVTVPGKGATKSTASVSYSVMVKCPAPRNGLTSSVSPSVIGDGVSALGEQTSLDDEEIVRSKWLNPSPGPLGVGTRITVQLASYIGSRLPEGVACQFSDSYTRIVVEGEVVTRDQDMLLIACHTTSSWDSPHQYSPVDFQVLVGGGSVLKSNLVFTYSHQMAEFLPPPVPPVPKIENQDRNVYRVDSGSLSRIEFTSENDSLSFSVSATKHSSQDGLSHMEGGIVSDSFWRRPRSSFALRSSSGSILFSPYFLRPPGGSGSGLGEDTFLSEPATDNYHGFGPSTMNQGARSLLRDHLISFEPADLSLPGVAFVRESTEHPGWSYDNLREVNILELSPQYGWVSGGTNVTVRVSNLEWYDAQTVSLLCSFGADHRAPVSVDSSSGDVHCSSPTRTQAGLPFGESDVMVRLDFVVLASGTIFTTPAHVFTLMVPFSVTALVPRSGREGTLIQVYGDNFPNNFGLECHFGSRTTPATIVSSQRLDCLVPSLETRTTRVTVSAAGLASDWHAATPFITGAPLLTSSAFPRGDYLGDVSDDAGALGLRAFEHTTPWTLRQTSAGLFLVSSPWRAALKKGVDSLALTTSDWTGTNGKYDVQGRDLGAAQSREFLVNSDAHGGTFCPIPGGVSASVLGYTAASDEQSSAPLQLSNRMRSSLCALLRAPESSTGRMGLRSSRDTMERAFWMMSRPVIDTILPLVKQGGERLVVVGNGFELTKELACRFSGTIASLNVVVPANFISSRKIWCMSPVVSTETYFNLEITLNRQDYFSAGPGFVLVPRFVMRSVSPVTGPITGGTAVTIIGSFPSGYLECRFGTRFVPAWILSDSRAICVSPKSINGFPGRVPLELSVRGQGGTRNARHFTYYLSDSATESTRERHESLGDQNDRVVATRRRHGVITGKAPRYLSLPKLFYAEPSACSISGAVNILVRGENFIDSGAITCSFGGTLVQGIFWSTTTIVCRAPRHTPGKVALEVSSDGGMLFSSGFPFDFYEELAVHSVLPNHGPPDGSTEVTITGGSFRNTTGIVCRFGDVKVPAVYVTSTRLRCRTPPLERVVETSVHVQVRALSWLIPARDARFLSKCGRV